MYRKKGYQIPESGKAAKGTNLSLIHILHMGSLFEVSAEGLTVVSVDGFRLALRKEALEKIEGGAFSFCLLYTSRCV